MMKRSSILLLLATVACSARDSSAAPKADHRPPTPNGPREIAILAGGCFWGMEHVMMEAPGIVDIEVGYEGGHVDHVTYEQVSEGDTGYAEAVRIVFDPSVISYEDLLKHYYFRGHDPTTVDRQNNDVGTQYRSEIFTLSEAQRRTAEAVKARVDRAGAWKRPVVTRIEPATTWVTAEAHHQDYLVKHPDGYNDHYLRDFDF